MMAIFKAFSITAAFALTIGLAAATASASVMADEFAACGANLPGVC